MLCWEICKCHLMKECQVKASIRQTLASCLAFLLLLWQLCPALESLGKLDTWHPRGPGHPNAHSRSCWRMGTSFYIEVCDSESQIVKLFSSTGKLLLSSPSDGLWSAGSNLSTGWPLVWHHGNPQKVEIKGDKLLAEGAIPTPAGIWLVNEEWHVDNTSVIGRRRWTWNGKLPSPLTVLSVRWHTAALSRNLVLPGVLYDGNQAGQASRRQGWNGLVAEWNGQPGDRIQVEEHRLPQTWASFQWQHLGSASAFVALHSVPSMPTNRHQDLYWSMGAEAFSKGTLLQLLSGPVSLNGQDGFTKTGQRNSTALLDVGLVVPPGGLEEKSYWIQLGEMQSGHAFRAALEAALLRANLSSEGLPDPDQILKAKARFALARWQSENAFHGFEMFGRNSNRRGIYAMGWAGQAEAPGFAFLILDVLDVQPGLKAIAKEALDVLSKAPLEKTGFMLALDGSGQWLPGVGRALMDPVSQGQAMGTFARAIAAGRAIGMDTKLWESFLQSACKLHANRILKKSWQPGRGAAEAFFVLPLSLASQLFGTAEFLQAAQKAGDWFAQLSKTAPLWGGTLDAQCEDKEGAWAGFQAFLALYEVTQKTSWLELAETAADLALTYTYLWDVDFPAGSTLYQKSFQSRGWTSVSVQNMHLDVYGVLYAPELWLLGQLTGRLKLRDVAKLMYRTAGQLMDSAGGHGEQVQQTRFAMRGKNLSNPDSFRGGYQDGYSPFWVTAHFLTAAAKFQQMGVWHCLTRC
ncbi:unnamed protein product [Effrenium voratum]|nr:unnamed protein product [Effrenium voratum]